MIRGIAVFGALTAFAYLLARVGGGAPRDETRELLRRFSDRACWPAFAATCELWEAPGPGSRWAEMEARVVCDGGGSLDVAFDRLVPHPRRDRVGAPKHMHPEHGDRDRRDPRERAPRDFARFLERRVGLGPDRLLHANYQVEHLGVVRMHGCEVARIALEGWAPGRPRREYWIDRSTGVLLGSAEWNYLGDLVARIRTAEFRWLDPAPDIAAQGTSEPRRDVPMEDVEKEYGEAVLWPSRLPRGFKITRARIDARGGKRGLVFDLTDGLATIWMRQGPGFPDEASLRGELAARGVVGEEVERRIREFAEFRKRIRSGESPIQGMRGPFEGTRKRAMSFVATELEGAMIGAFGEVPQEELAELLRDLSRSHANPER